MNRRCVLVPLLLALAGAIWLYSDAAPAAAAAPRHATAAYRAWAIRKTFPYPYKRAAVRVARCESGLRPWARNGQYLGVFQMGSAERARYGHGRGVWRQTRAALRYFNASGHTWRAWSCKP